MRNFPNTTAPTIRRNLRLVGRRLICSDVVDPRSVGVAGTNLLADTLAESEGLQQQLQKALVSVKDTDFWGIRFRFSDVPEHRIFFPHDFRAEEDCTPDFVFLLLIARTARSDMAGRNRPRRLKLLKDAYPQLVSPLSDKLNLMLALGPFEPTTPDGRLINSFIDAGRTIVDHTSPRFAAATVKRLGNLLAGALAEVVENSRPAHSKLGQELAVLRIADLIGDWTNLSDEDRDFIAVRVGVLLNLGSKQPTSARGAYKLLQKRRERLRIQRRQFPAKKT